MSENEPKVVSSADEALADIMSKENEKKKKPKKSLTREIVEWILTIVCAVAIAFVIRTYGFEFVRVDGHSMDHTLADGEIMFVTKFDYVSGNPQRFDVVVCHYPNRTNKGLLGIETETNFVKRVVGLPGDHVAVKDGYLYVNGEKYEETYLTYRPDYEYPALYIVGDEIYTAGMQKVDKSAIAISRNETAPEITAETRYVLTSDTFEYIVPEGKYFVLGDNRSNSNDSHLVGPLDRNMIVGHVRQILYPFSSFRGIQ